MVSTAFSVYSIRYSACLVVSRGFTVFPAGRRSGAKFLQASNWNQFAINVPITLLDFCSKNLLMIGKTYMRLKDKEKAIAFLTRARDYPAGSAEDVEVI